MINSDRRRCWCRFSPPVQKSSFPSSIIFAKASLLSLVNAQIMAKAFFTGSTFCGSSFFFHFLSSSPGQSAALCPVFLHLKHFPCFINVCLSLNVNASTSITLGSFFSAGLYQLLFVILSLFFLIGPKNGCHFSVVRVKLDRFLEPVFDHSENYLAIHDLVGEGKVKGFLE